MVAFSFYFQPEKECDEGFYSVTLAQEMTTLARPNIAYTGHASDRGENHQGCELTASECRLLAYQLLTMAAEIDSEAADGP
jgi:hypothetical protein